MATLSTTALVLKVERSEPELVVPSKATPHECKQLSDIDDQESLRYQIPMIQFYHHNQGMDGRDPVEVIKKAVAEALVFYYPFAGRLRQGSARKLFVECTGEGILFVQANADAILQQFEDYYSDLQPPFSCMDDLLYHFPNSHHGILNSPLLLIQFVGVIKLMKTGLLPVWLVNPAVNISIILSEIDQRKPTCCWSPLECQFLIPIEEVIVKNKMSKM